MNRSGQKAAYKSVTAAYGLRMVNQNLVHQQGPPLTERTTQSPSQRSVFPFISAEVLHASLSAYSAPSNPAVLHQPFNGLGGDKRAENDSEEVLAILQGLQSL